MLSKKTEYYDLVTKVNAIDTKIPSISGLVTKAQHDLDKQGLQKFEDVDKKTPNSSGLIKKTDYNTKNCRD